MIRSLYDREIKFEKGIDHIIRNAGSEIRIVFLVCLPDYLSNPRPVLYAHLREYSGEGRTLPEIESNYRAFYDLSLSDRISRREEG